MQQLRRPVDTEDEQAGANRQTASLAALAVTLLLVVASLALLHHLRASAAIEDCVMSGRSNCSVTLTLP